MKKRIFTLIAIAALFYACGESSDSPTSKPESQEETYSSIEDLPNCSENRNGKVLVVEDDNNAYGCQDGQWEILGQPFETEDDLPNCTRSKNNMMVYLTDSEESLVCIDNEWTSAADLMNEEDDSDQENDDEEEDDDQEEDLEDSDLEDDDLEDDDDISGQDEEEDSENPPKSSSSKGNNTLPESASSTESSSSASTTPSSASTIPSSAQQSTGPIKGTCGPTLSTITKNQSTTWKFTNTGTTRPSTYMWIFTNGSSVTSTASSPSITYRTVGTGTATLLLDAGLETESSISCSNLTVQSPAITGCSCSRTLTTATNDLADNRPVKYTWSVSGCSSEGSEPLSYSWSGSISGTGSSVVASYTSRGNYTASVTVTNTDNSSKAVSCSDITVKDSDNPYVETNWTSELTLTAGSYYIPKCRSNSGGSTIQIMSGSSNDCLTWFDNQTTIRWDGGTWSTCSGIAIGFQYPLYITIPAGQSMVLYSCW